MLFVQRLTNSLVAYAATFVWKPERAHAAGALRADRPRLPGRHALQQRGAQARKLPHAGAGQVVQDDPRHAHGRANPPQEVHVRDYVCVLVITAGIAVFQLGKASAKHASRENSTYSLLLLFSSLTLDGVSGPQQEEIAHQLRPSALEGFFFCLENPAILNSVFYFSVCSALGQNFIFFTIQQSTCTTITTTRKFFTIPFSVVWYGHELSLMSWVGVAIVNVGLAWELSSKYHKYQAQNAKLT
ncbi:hypothetical protein PR003_g13457 [Phytophthora rubi]|uniref:Uncharacterized protein n=1 Tax=Phytophthora rubi TaxID=129364 RepID=A0A6A3LMA0_9STRA|nr:hypothetical protein PR002_g12902 [Phytophthora rubi]KAE9023732.1 hypothetical protein PR001_g12836 [Phytophthora rubi]KAE9334561.1 hypothetical protein PR003_g13457 [Phytophthora rubi]